MNRAVTFIQTAIKLLLQVITNILSCLNFNAKPGQPCHILGSKDGSCT